MINKTPQHGAAKVDKEAAFLRFLRATEIDACLLRMIAAFFFIWVGFHVYGQVVNDFGAFFYLSKFMEPFGANRLFRSDGNRYGIGDCDPPY